MERVTMEHVLPRVDPAIPHPQRRHPLCPRRGFTLVEILVVIGIIALLLGILLPVLGKARESSRKTVCLANLRTIGQSMYQYANDFSDRLPNANPSDTWKASVGGEALVPFANDYVTVTGSFHCPSDSDPVPTRIVTADYDVPNSAHVSYDFYSIYWAPEYGPLLTQLRGRAPLAWDLDGGELKSPIQNHGNKGGNVVFADGHAEWQDRGNWDGGNWPNPAAEFYPNPNAP